MQTIQTIGIIGAGTMGNGIAQACATSGLQVVMVDINEAAVQKGIATVSGSLDRLIKKEKLTATEKDAALARIKGSTSYDDLKGAELVIEAATENEGLKVKILQQLDALLPPAPSWPPTPARSASPSWRPPPSGPTVSLACTSSTRCP